MDVEGIEPSALTLDLAEQLDAQRAAEEDAQYGRHLARRFAQHLLDIGVAQPVPLTEAQIARAALLADFETYLVKQRGLSPRTHLSHAAVSPTASSIIASARRWSIRAACVLPT